MVQSLNRNGKNKCPFSQKLYVKKNKMHQICAVFPLAQSTPSVFITPSESFRIRLLDFCCGCCDCSVSFAASAIPSAVVGMWLTVDSLWFCCCPFSSVNSAAAVECFFECFSKLTDNFCGLGADDWDWHLVSLPRSSAIFTNLIFSFFVRKSKDKPSDSPFLL